MTTEIEAKAEDEQPEGPEPEYAIDPGVIEARGQSVSAVIGERLCDAGLAKLKSPDDWRTMTYKELRKLFKDRCSNQEGYLSPQQPLLETVVRMLLSSKADRLSLSQIHGEVSDLWMTSPWPRHIAIESLRRVLDRGTSHGIVRVEAA
jgi:hypothetical protein